MRHLQYRTQVLAPFTELRTGKPNDSCKDNQQHDTYAIHVDLRYAQPGRPLHDICCDEPPGYPTNQAEHTRLSMTRTALYNGPATNKLCT